MKMQWEHEQNIFAKSNDNAGNINCMYFYFFLLNPLFWFYCLIECSDVC